MTHPYTLSQLGWQPVFQQQLTLEELEDFTIARIFSLQRSQFIALSETGSHTVVIRPDMPQLTVGDWVLLNHDGQLHRALERLSLFSRKAAGTRVARQLIAANVNTLFVVCSMNQDFSLNRIERYLAMANEAGVEPVVVLTKSDLCDDPHSYQQQVQSLDPLLMVLTINCLDPKSVEALSPWCGSGNTVALLGSSGVGKSTITNTLCGTHIQHTSSIREDDGKGRHTTTGRSLHLLPGGGLLLDTPGMRELQLADCEHGIEETFADIGKLSAQCRFKDCRHQGEPGCAVQAAIASGSLDERRLLNYLKLMREQAFNSATLAEKRERDRKFGRYIRSVQKESSKTNKN
jgi:ribosome biogenesis GTPase